MIPGNDSQDFCTDDSRIEHLDPAEINRLRQKFLDAGLSEEVARKIAEATASGILDENEIDNRTTDMIKEVGPGALTCLQELLSHPNLSSVKSRVAYLCGMISSLKMRSASQAPSGHSQIKGPDNKKVDELKARLGLPLEITSGQRHLGPSPSWSGPVPSNEVFIGHLPYDIFEDELIPLFEKFGSIYDSRIMLDPSGQFCPPPGHKGFAFINFVDRHSAEEAIKKMNGYEIRGRKMKVNPSYQNTRLFVGNLPKNKSRDEIFDELKKVTEGCSEVIIYADINDSRVKNRGFCFADYDCHKNASAARRRLSQGQATVFGRTVVADWADPIQEPDGEIMSKVKVLYVKNLKEEVTEEQLQQKCSEFGFVEKCKKIKDYAFVTYRDRPAALEALESLNGFMMAGIALDVTLARPQSDELKNKKEERKKQFESKGTPSYGGPSGATSYGYGMGGGSWGEPMGAPGRMPHRGAPAGAGRGGRGRDGANGSKGRGARGGPGGSSRGGRGSAPFRGSARGGGAPSMASPYMSHAAPVPPPLSQAWGSSNGAGYGGYSGGYATVPASGPPTDYYSQPYEGYEQSHAPPPPLDDYSASYGSAYGYPHDPGHVPSYEYGHAAPMAPVHATTTYGGNGTYGPPKSHPVRGAGRGKSSSGRGANRGAARGMKRSNPAAQGKDRGPWGNQAPKQAKMSQGSAPMYQSSVSGGPMQSQGYDMGDVNGNPYVAPYAAESYGDAYGAVGPQMKAENQNGLQQQQQQQWYSNNFSEGWQ